jgi:glycosyltransferase involved in cell wall biosynthesis
MARIVVADDGIAFDGRTAEEGPLGGAESAVVGLVEALAARGHDVRVVNRCEAPLDWKGVRWRPLGAEAIPAGSDLYIGNRGHRLIGLAPRAGARVFWIHNPARYLMKPRYLARLAWRRPAIVFSGAYHASTYPAWAPSGGRRVIPYGVPELFRHAGERAPPGPRAIFTSSPLRSLDWLLDLWVERIRPAVPGAELHVFSGTATYGAVGAAKSGAMTPVLDRAAALGGHGVQLRGAVPKRDLVGELQASRVYLYRGDENETFCMSAAEAQASGVPGVVEAIGSLPERVVDGATGFVVRGREAFAAAAIRLLREDALWQAQHRACLERQRRFGWPEAAASFEELLRKAPL